jgi:hypothetical protein
MTAIQDVALVLLQGSLSRECLCQTPWMRLRGLPACNATDISPSGNRA